MFHCHTELSLLDSCTKFQDYIDAAVENKQTAIAFTEHGRLFNWVNKKIACDKAGIKYLHGVKCYLTESHTEKVRDNYHTILIAKNYEGVKEINALMSLSEQRDHFYHKNRLSFAEFLSISPNVIKISACLASPLNRLPDDHPYYLRLLKHYDYLEVQPHLHPDQISFNRHLALLSDKYGIPLIAGTDTHNSCSYKAECRQIIFWDKKIDYSDEDSFDLIYKTYDELVAAFQAQDSLPQALYMQAIENTNLMADSVEDFQLDTSFKYPSMYGEEDSRIYEERVAQKLEEKIQNGGYKVAKRRYN